jgi:hypothetical protein
MCCMFLFSREDSDYCPLMLLQILVKSQNFEALVYILQLGACEMVHYAYVVNPVQTNDFLV